jgi:hypothetical protein
MNSKDAATGIGRRKEGLRTIGSDSPEDSYVATSFLLIQATGIKTTRYLHNDVTHILCNIKHDFLPWNPNIPLTMFADIERGKELMSRVAVVKKESEDPLFLVSPDWIKRMWTG